MKFRGAPSLLVILAMLGAAPPALAASGTWSGAGTNANWSNSADWQGSVIPGGTNGIANVDTAYFTQTVTGSNGTTNAVVIDAGRNIGTIDIDTPASSSFVIGSGTGHPLLITAGGQIRNDIAATETVAAPVVFLGTGCSLWNGNGGSGASTFIFSGALSGSNAGAATVTLTGAANATGNVNGAISNGAGSTLGFAISAEIWNFNNTANSFSGGITVQSGTLGIGSGGGPGTGTLTISGGTVQSAAGAALTLTNNNPEQWTGDFSINGGSSGMNMGTGTVALGSNRNLTVTNSVTVGGSVIDTGSGFGITKAGSGTLILTGSNNYSGQTGVSTGTLQIGTSTNTPVNLAGGVNVSGGATLEFKTNLSGTTASIGGGGILTDDGTGAITVYQAPAFSGTISAVNGASGSTIVLNGDPTSATTIQSTVNTTGQKVKFGGGNWTLTGDGNYGANLEVDGGFVLRPASTGNFYNIVSLVVTGGTLESLTTYGMRIGNTFGGQSSGENFSVVQTGGTVIVGENPLTMGSTTAGAVGSYLLSGGTLSLTNGQQMDIGASTSGSGSAMLMLSGSGTLLASGNFTGDQGTGARQAFVWTGGTLSVNNYNATNLTSGTAVAVSTTSNTLVNAGGTLAPGGAGAPGQMTITGNYAVTAAGAVLSIGIGGTTRASVFQDSASKYDTVTVTGTVSLNGTLAVYLTNGFAPTDVSTFTILNSTASGTAISGSFQNIAFGGRMTTADGLGSFIVNKVGNAIVLSDFVWLGNAPQITSQPQSTTVIAGKTATFSVGVVGAQPFNYQWYDGGAAIATGTLPYLVIADSAANNSGSYYVVVSNTYGSMTSGTATLAVNPDSTGTGGMLYTLNQTPVYGTDAIIDAFGTTQGTLTGSPAPVLVPGPSVVTGSAWNFSGGQGYVSVASDSFTNRLGDINQTTGITVGMWIKLLYAINSGLDNSRAMGIGPNDSICDVTTSNGSGNFQFTFDNSATISSGSVLDGNWHHVVATLDYQKSSNNLVLYVDGKSASTSTVPITSSFSSSSTSMTIGKYNNNGPPFVGSLGQVITFDRALTAGEISSIYTSGTVANQAPMVVPGATTTNVQWPANTDTVYATVTDDGLPNPPGTVTGSWSKVSSPSGGSVVFSNTNGLTCGLTFSGTGTYIVRYTASDSQLSNYGDVTIYVAANHAPVINSCAVSPTFLSTQSGSATVSLAAYATDDGLPNPPGMLTTTWSQVSGPAAVTVAYPSSLSTAGSVPNVDGTYVMQFSAYDGALTTSSNVTFVLANNLPPSISASAAIQTLTWPANSTTLEATVSDDGLPNPPGTTTVTWTQVSGPAAATLSATNSANCPVTFPAQGQYVFQASAFDGALTTATTTWVTVWSPGRPIVLPGSSRSLWLPNAACTLSGTLMAITGSNDPVQWSVVQGPGPVTFRSPNALVTTASFSAAGEYWVQLSATDGIYTNSGRIAVEVYDPTVAPGEYGGGNFGYTGTNAALLTQFTGDLQLPYNFNGLDWTRLKPPPPPYVHPRILFNPDDLPDLRNRLANVSGTSTQGPVLMNTITTTVQNDLTNQGATYNQVYNDLANGVSSSFASQGGNEQWIVCLMGYEAFRCLIDNDAVGGAKVGAALATVANYTYPILQAKNSNDWQNVVFPAIYSEWMGYSYDFAYNFMTPAEQASVRQLLTLATTNPQGLGINAIPAFHTNTSNWNQWNGFYLVIDALAVEGEAGFDTNTLPRLQGNFERMWSMDIFPEGSLYEGMGKGALFAESLIALGKRGIMIPAITGANNHVHQFYAACMETFGYGFTWDEWDAGNGQFGNNDAAKHADVSVIKFLFPGDPVVDFIHRNEFGTSNFLTSADLTQISADPGDMHDFLGRTICTLDFDTALTWDQAVTQQVTPNMALTQMFNNHGLMISRTDWTSNGMRLFFQPRSEPGGHAERDRDVFTLDALGRIWIPLGGPEPESYDYSIDSTVPRIDNVGPTTVAAKFVDFSDSPTFTYAAGDASIPYSWGETTSPGPLEGWNYNQMLYNQDQQPWANQPWGLLPGWDNSIYSPLYWAPNTPVQRAFRTAAVVRGTNSYVIVADDLQKDGNPHSYTDRLILANDLTNITVSGSDAIVTSSTGGSVSMLVRVLRCSGTATFSAGFNSDHYNVLDVDTTTVAPNYILMVYPYPNGTQLPATSWVGNVVYVAWPGGQVDHIGFTPNADGRTRLSFARPSSDTTPPVITVPANIVITATAAQGNVVNFVVTGSDNVNGVVPVACLPPSGSVFPIGITTVVCTATDSSLNSAEAMFTVTVQPGTFVLTAPTGFSASPGNQSAALAWNSVAPATSYNLYRSLTSGSGFALLAAGLASTRYIDTGLANGTTYYYMVTAVNGTGEGPASATVSVVPVAVPAPWLDQDIGSVGLSGSSTVSETGTISITAAGSQIGGSSDSFHFVSQPWLGNCALVAHFLGFRNATTYSTAGVMLRQSLAANSANAYMGVQNYSSQYLFSYRSTAGGGTTTTPITHSSLPQWLKLLRSGTTVTAYDSGDSPPGGQAWVQVGSPASVSLSSTSSIDAGLALASNNTSALCTGSFDHFGIYTAPVLALPANMTVEATGSYGAVAAFVVTGSSNVDGALPVVCSPASGSVFPLGVTQVTATGTDNAGEVVTGTFSVTVDDTTPPVITVPSPISVYATTATGAYVTFATTAVDLVSGTVPTTDNPPSGSLFPIATTTVTTTATDAAGNLGTAGFTVTVSVPAVSAAETAAPPLTLSGSNIGLTVNPTVPGRTYQLQSSATMQAGSWINIGPVQTGGGSAVTLSGTFNPAIPAQFYRLELGP
jgi:autotransporter-associated beta strand protein